MYPVASASTSVHCFENTRVPFDVLCRISKSHCIIAKLDPLNKENYQNSHNLMSRNVSKVTQLNQGTSHGKLQVTEEMMNKMFRFSKLSSSLFHAAII